MRCQEGIKIRGHVWSNNSTPADEIQDNVEPPDSQKQV